MKRKVWKTCLRNIRARKNFKKKISTYWLDALHIREKVSFDTVFIPGGRNLGSELRSGIRRRDTNNKTLRYLRNSYQNFCFPRVANQSQKDFYLQNCCRAGRPIGMTTAEFQPAAPIQIKPWWAPTQTVNVCPGLVRGNSCGANLKNCFPTDGTLADGNFLGIVSDSDNYYLRNLHDAFTFEPGRLIARVIVEDRPWDEVLTTNKSMATGTMQHFLKNTRWGGIIVAAAPPGTWQDQDGIVNLQNAENPEDAT